MLRSTKRKLLNAGIAIMVLVVCVIWIAVAGPAKDVPLLVEPIPDAVVMDEEWGRQFETVSEKQTLITKMVTHHTLYELMETWPDGEAIPLRIRTDWSTGDQEVAFKRGDGLYAEKLAGCPPNCEDVPGKVDLSLGSLIKRRVR